MKKVISLTSPKEHYKRRTRLVFWCFDDRFWRLRKRFFELLQAQEADVDNVDLVQFAGGAKALAADPGLERDFALDQIRKSVKLHEPESIALVVHADCGAYGGSGQFADHGAEMEHHQAELAKGKATVEKEFPHLTVECYIADFDGLYQLDREEEEAVAAAA